MSMAKALSLIAFAALMTSSCGYQAPDNGQPGAIAHDKSGAALRFAGVDRVQGTRFFTLPIVSGTRNPDSYSIFGSGSDERNRLIVDSATGASRRVLPDENYAIVNWIEPGDRSSNGDMREESAATDHVQPTAGALHWYAAVVKRPAKDKDDPATYDVLLGRFDDAQQQWIARGLSGVEEIWDTPDGRLAMVAAVGGRGIYRVYDPLTFKQLLQSDLNVQ
jgi:hypothetical protein